MFLGGYGNHPGQRRRDFGFGWVGSADSWKMSRPYRRLVVRPAREGEGDGFCVSGGSVGGNVYEYENFLIGKDTTHSVFIYSRWMSE